MSGKIRKQILLTRMKGYDIDGGREMLLQSSDHWWLQGTNEHATVV
jgi:hypothetical protein